MDNNNKCKINTKDILKQVSVLAFKDLKKVW